MRIESVRLLSDPTALAVLFQLLTGVLTLTRAAVQLVRECRGEER